ncbi:MAG: hypothetical protein R3281_09400 [Balneolaceae bacterium]|nr:hypothetical protein [Balneolaceae bacterium]
MTRNFEKWNILGEQVFGNGFVGQSYEEEVNYLREWLDRRLS